jgi:glycosyltransferase involved in cell wall biosynthesis
LIDSLDSGGAQRQMCMLAPLLKGRGYDVEVLTYFPHDFFAHLLEEAGIRWRLVPWNNKLQRIFTVRKALRQAKPDVVISFLETPSLMAELAIWPGRPFKLIVSDRNTTLKPAFKDKISYNLHRLADAVVPNSYSQKKVLLREAPYLKDRIHPIINCVDLEKYKPADTMAHNDPMKILVVGSFKRQKNPLGLCEAARITHQKKKTLDFQIHWYGNNLFVNGQPSRFSGPYLEVLEKIKEYRLDGVIKIFEPVKDILSVYQNADVLCLPSFFEGCPNVLAEAMACGKPVLASNVCDNSMFVEDDGNGFLFDPNDPNEIASSIVRFLQLPTESRNRMAIRSRQIVEEMMSPQLFVQRYIKLINHLFQENGC